MNLNWIKPFFIIGCIMLICATMIMIVKPFESDYSVSAFVLVSFVGLAIISLTLLFYTLFFALPFRETYVEGSKQKLCTEGIYSLCRHPGVLFFGMFYLFLSIGLGKPFILMAGLLFTGLNLLYVYLQDKYFFPRAFDGYDTYQQHTNFIVPSSQSIRKCFKHYR